MTAQQLVGGLRERGYSVIRMSVPPVVLIPRVDADDPAYRWLQGLGCYMAPYRLSEKVPLTYEASLNRANVEGDVWASAA